MTRRLSFYTCCFFAYSLLGWAYEVFLEVVIYGWGFSNRGILFGPYCPIYGFGALVFIFAFYRSVKGKGIKVKLLRAPIIFLGCALAATLIELATSYICEAALGYWPWQTYTDYAVNFQGRVALSPSIRFGLGGILFLYIVQPLLDKLLSEISTRNPAIVIAGVMLTDTVVLIIKSLGGSS